MSKIVHVSETLATGVLSIIATLMAEQVKAGHDVTLIGSSQRADTPADWRSRLPAAAHVIDLPMPQQIGWGDMHCAWALRQQLRAIRPDAIHLHSSKAGAIGRLASLGLPGQVIYQPHGFAFLRADVSGFKQVAFGVIEGLLALLPGKIVACSQGEADASRRFLAWREVHMVPNGIALGEALGARAAGQAPGPLSQGGLPVVGTCGRISPQKNPEFFAEVARLMAGRCEFRWIGGGDHPEGERALTQAGVHLLGWRTRDQVLADLQALDLYMQTSAWEGMPVSVMEAMACGLPSVVTRIPGNRDLIEPVDPASVVDTPAEMARRLQHWIDHPLQAKAFGEALKKEVLCNYTAAAMSARYEVLYRLRAA
jgi:glycosyltransferase involved in cell wall biosynthesis